MNDGTTPLILAARLAVEGMVAELINCQADVNAVDDHGRGKAGVGMLTCKASSREQDLYMVLKDLCQIQIHSSFIHLFILPFDILSSDVCGIGGLYVKMGEDC